MHSTNPVPFARWNGRGRDAVERFGEEPVLGGRYAAAGLTHLDRLALLGAVPARPLPREVVSLGSVSFPDGAHGR